MRLLIDSHILIAIADERRGDLPAKVLRVLHEPANKLFVSVASLWEIAIKVRLGKLVMLTPLEELPDLCAVMPAGLIRIEPNHALAQLNVTPPTRDPFDRLLLAQCQCDDLRLVTLDRALAGHPLAAQP